MTLDKEKIKKLEDYKLFTEVNWLYERLSKKEMQILLKWVWANCETVREEKDKEINEWKDRCGESQKQVEECQKEIQELKKDSHKNYIKIDEIKPEDIQRLTQKIITTRPDIKQLLKQTRTELLSEIEKIMNKIEDGNTYYPAYKIYKDQWEEFKSRMK